MDTDAGVRKLVELIFGEKPTIPEEMAAHSSIPSTLLNDDFPKKLQDVLDFRKYLLSDRWKYTLDGSIRKLLFSHMNYVTDVMYLCLCENICNLNIFDSFISVCALLNLISYEAFLQTQVDFSGLNPDIFMVFYQKAMNSPFRKRKDFYRLVEYIRNHKYHKWLNDSTNSALQKRYIENLCKELNSYRAFDKIPLDKVSKLIATGASLGSEVLSSTSVKLPDLPSEYELIQRLVKYRKRETNEAKKVETTLTMKTSHEKARKDETFLTAEASRGEASLHSDCKPELKDPQEDAAWHESIIEAVIRHNHSKDSGNEIANNQSHEKVNDILKHLESKIKSLIEVLDECGEE